MRVQALSLPPQVMVACGVCTSETSVGEDVSRASSTGRYVIGGDVLNMAISMCG